MRVVAEHERIEELVVDAAIDHVDALEASRRSHVDDVVVADEVAALDELDPHLAREERVLEVGGVVDARGQQDDGRGSSRAGGRDRARAPPSSSCG